MADVAALEAVKEQLQHLDRQKRSEVLRLRIEKDLLDAITELANDAGMDRSKLVRLVLSNFVEGAKS